MSSPPFASAEAVITSLRGVCPRISGHGSGCAFPVAPGHLLTCAHVVGPAASPGASVDIHPWRGESRQGTLAAVDLEQDLALIADMDAAPVAPLSGDLALGDRLVGIGYPKREQGFELDQFFVEYEGVVELGDNQDLLKLKAGQVQHGFSGGPLVNLRTGAIAGLTRHSRNTGLDLGGWGVPVSAIVRFCAKAGLELSLAESPRPSPAEILQRLQRLLVGLPRWNEARARRALLERIFHGDALLGQLQLEGPGADVATDFARLCLDYHTPDDPDRSPLRRLLEGLADEFGDISQGREIDALRALLHSPAFSRHPT